MRRSSLSHCSFSTFK